MTSDAKIVCVLKSGGEFEPNHVKRLVGQLRGNIGAAQIICMTDLVGEISWVPGVEVIPLQQDWPGYWCKMEMYKVPGPALYLDLDVNVVGDLRPFLDLCQIHAFIANRDFWRGQGVAPPYINAAVLGWAGDMRWIYDKFAARADHWMHIWGLKGPKWREIRQHSDQGMLVDWIGLEHIKRWQWELPGMLYSFKREVKPGLVDVSTMRLVVSHGEPRPWALGGADSWFAATSCTPKFTS